MGHKSFIICDSCHTEQENTRDPIPQPLGWAVLHVQVSAKASFRVGGDPAHRLETVDGLRTLCPSCIDRVQLAAKGTSTESAALYHQHLDQVAGLLQMPGSPNWDECMERLRQIVALFGMPRGRS